LSGGLRQELGRLSDDVAVPAGAVLVLEQHELAVVVEAGVGAGAVQLDEGEEADDLGLGWHELVEQGGEPVGVVDEVA
jgi:hypothetical protein